MALKIALSIASLTFCSCSLCTAFCSRTLMCSSMTALHLVPCRLGLDYWNTGGLANLGTHPSEDDGARTGMARSDSVSGPKVSLQVKMAKTSAKLECGSENLPR